MHENLWMDNVGFITCCAIDTIEAELKKLDIPLNNIQENAFYDVIFKLLEDMSNGNYRREM